MISFFVCACDNDLVYIMALMGICFGESGREREGKRERKERGGGMLGRGSDILIQFVFCRFKGMHHDYSFSLETVPQIQIPPLFVWSTSLPLTSYTPGHSSALIIDSFLVITLAQPQYASSIPLFLANPLSQL